MMFKGNACPDMGPDVLDYILQVSYRIVGYVRYWQGKLSSAAEITTQFLHMRIAYVLDHFWNDYNIVLRSYIENYVLSERRNLL